MFPPIMCPNPLIWVQRYLFFNHKFNLLVISSIVSLLSKNRFIKNYIKIMIFESLNIHRLNFTIKFFNKLCRDSSVNAFLPKNLTSIPPILFGQSLLQDLIHFKISRLNFTLQALWICFYI